MVTHRETAHARAHRLNYAGTLMAEHDRLRRMAAGMLVQVGMADADGDDPHPHLARARLLLLKLLKARLGQARPADGGGDPHQGLPATGGALCEGLTGRRISLFHGT